MNEIKRLIVQILIANGFSEKIPLKDRKYQIDIAENILFFIWVTVSVLLFQKLLDGLVWLLGVGLSFILEQIISIIILWIRHKWRKDKSFFRTSTPYHASTSRTIYERVGVLFFIIFIPVQVVLHIVPSGNNSAFWFGGALAYLLMVSVDNSILKKINNRNSLAITWVSLGVELHRAWRQIVSINYRGIRLAIPGVFLGVLLGSVSQDFWLVIENVSWFNLGLIFGLLLLFIIIPSSSQIDHSIEHEISNLNLSENVFGKKNLYRSIISQVHINEAKKIFRLLFDEYEQKYLWKLRKPIYKEAFEALSTEMKNRAKWQFWISLPALTLSVFILTVLIIIIVFPSDIVTDWVGRQVSYNLSNFPSFILGILNSGTIPNLADDPIIKFSAVLTALVIAYFANSYSQDSQTVFNNLHVDKFVLNDLLTLLCGYSMLIEDKSQVIDQILVASKDSYRFYAPVILIPDNCDKLSVEKLIESKTIYCVIFAQKESFLNSLTAISKGLSEEKDFWKLPLANQQSKCWVGLGQGGNTSNLHEFNDFEIARDWLEKNKQLVIDAFNIV